MTNETLLRFVAHPLTVAVAAVGFLMAIMWSFVAT
jgi:hypothetical protein